MSIKIWAAGPVSIGASNLAIIVPADVLAPNRATPSACRVLNENLGILFKFSMIRDTFTDRWRHPKWSAKSSEILRPFEGAAP